MTVMAGRKAIMEIFQVEGVEYVFGNPGTTELGFIDCLSEYPGLKYILALQEGVAVGIAHAYSSASGKTGVVNLHVAPGLGNAMGALYNASVGKVPLVVAVGQQDSRLLVREPVLAHDLVGMARPLVKWAVQLQHAEEIPVVLPRAFKTAQDPPRGPVLISLPSNVIEEEIDFHSPAPSNLYRRSRPDPQGITAITELILESRHPVIICGDGVAASGAQSELVQVAELIGAPVWAGLFTGNLNFPFSHPHYRGKLLPEYQGINALLAEADLVLAVGANLFEEVFYRPVSPLPEGCRLIQVDNSSWDIGKNIAPAIGLLADPKSALAELLESLKLKMDETAERLARDRHEAMVVQKQEERSRQEKRAKKKWDASPISTTRLMAELGNCLPDNVVIFDEAITASPDLERTILLDRPESYFADHGGGIGQGLPGAIGIKLAKPDRPVVAVVGDGSAMYTIQALWTAAHNDIPVIYIIISNQSYRILKYNMNRYRGQRKIAPKAEPFPHMDLAGPSLNFVDMARGMGLAGKCVTEPAQIKPAIEEALSANKAYLLEVKTEGSVAAQ